MNAPVAGVAAVTIPLIMLAAFAGHARRPRLLSTALRMQRVLPRRLTGPVAALAVTAEGGTGVTAAGGLLLGRDALLRAALGAAAVLLVAYAAYGASVTRTRPSAPCGCTGSLASPMTSWVAARAAVLSALAAAGAVWGPPAAQPGAETAIIGLAGLSFAVILWTLPEALEERAPGTSPAVGFSSQ
ncbi:hypothetical protein GCM10010191_25900 [Actinomadura vinacea]|uniref:Methylamine utilisation protein MauE domain-containing protein n=1 Tax=Actinomadura vinacea TaxID=115336 RepID=A0ABP5VXT2_9ACTN